MVEPTAPAAAPAAPAAGPGQAPPGGWMSIISSGLRMMMIYWAISYFMGGGKKAAPPTPALDDATSEYTPPAAVKSSVSQYYPLWNKQGIVTDLYVYVSEDEHFTDFTNVGKLVWKQTDLVYGNVKDVRTGSTTVDFSKDVQNNGTLYAHLYLTERGKSPNPRASSYVEEQTIYSRKLISRYYKKKKNIKKKKLVGDKKEEEAVELEKEEEVSSFYLIPELDYISDIIVIAGRTVRRSAHHFLLVEQFNHHSRPEFNPIPAALPPAVMNRVNVYKDGLHYKPIFEVDDFWLMSDNLQPINHTTPSGNLTLFFPAKFEENFKMQNAMMGVEQKETDEIKRMFLETNPILLALTVFVSLLHSVFDFLAFKNDIAFWQNKKDLDGMSFRSILLNVGFQAIIFLYLLDNETSWMILISNGVGLLIEAWKIQKTVIVKTKQEFPFVEFIDKFKPSKTARKTMKYDKYLSYVLYPLLAGYATTLWYSYVVGTLVGFVYMFGFISMTPQLFINYKLKSVAHMPWKTFMYKALNTFIDDLFAFIIKMPWLHRLACLRDDVIFLVYLYQRWIYPEDKRRRNEFGQVGEDIGEEEDDGSDSDDDELVKKERKEKKELKAAEKDFEKNVDASADSEGMRKRRIGGDASAPAVTPALSDKKSKDTSKTK
ncbi:cleft lip and palate transmembrane protein 1-domain-containing protein [Chytridium lagenaria]|nr:cleft lip and palate transmembrane protein 1-domain-containing protein [Chytridium lagenaria]